MFEPHSAKADSANIVWHGQHISIAKCGHWEFAMRNTGRPAVGIVALTDDGKIVLVEQFRPPVNRNVVELPAGLTGDIAGAETESLQAAAQRELLEETGYKAARWTELTRGFSSPGITDEEIVLFLAEGLTKATSGGGGDSEQITVHEIPLESVFDWLRQHEQPCDLKLLAGMCAARQVFAERQGRTKSKNSGVPP
ncbi:MAG TPA: NUDIX hydrolase [Pirellulales bacterium]|jgi:ADP-ribose pyrophosphatase